MNRTTFFFTLVVGCCLFACQSNQETETKATTSAAPEPPATAVKTSPQMTATAVSAPKGYTELASATGDLFGDQEDELVVVYDNGNETDFGTERVLIVYEKTGADWQKKHQAIGGVLPSEQGGMLGDPFNGVRIDKQAIVIEHSGGSRERWEYTHRFRFQNEQFALIGATVQAGTPCASFTKLDYNLSTGEYSYQKINEACDSEGEKQSSSIGSNEQGLRATAAKVTLTGFEPGLTPFNANTSNDPIYY